MNSKICTLLGIRYPVFQGAMAWVSDAKLAAAVSNAGGLGVVAAGNAPADVVRHEIRAAKAKTEKPFGVNIMLLSPYADDIVQLVCDEGVRLVTTGAGNPGKYMDTLKAKGITVVPIAPSVALAKRMAKMGADAIIAEGMEAGGHIGKLTTMAMVPQIVDAVDIPVIAAGGIGDGRGMAAALMLGADAVQLGTRFLVAAECAVHDNYKQAILKAKDIDTTITGAPTGHPVRIIRNRLARQFEELERNIPDLDTYMKKFEELGKGALQRAAKDGDMDSGSIMSGQIAGLVNKEQTCEAMLAEIMAECRAAIQNAAGRWSI